MKNRAATEILLSLVLLLSGAVISSCGNESVIQDNPEVVAPVRNSIWLKVRLWMPTSSQTRSNPTGGEDGDGRESALARENRIHNINLFFYSHLGGNGLNETDPSAISIEKHIYETTIADDGFDREDLFDNDDITAVFSEKLIKIDDYEPGDNTWVLIIANAGNIEGVETLEDLRDMVFAVKSWKGDKVRTSTDFTMSTARFNLKYNGVADGKIVVDNRDGSEENPFYMETTLERTAARIDFWYGEQNEVSAKDEFVYDVRHDNSVVGKVRIQNIAPVNMMDNPSYVFKHVTDGFSTSIVTVCADETPERGKPTNYVLEPTTLFKNSADTPTALSLYGDSRADYARSNPDDFFNETNTVKSILENGNTMAYMEDDPTLTKCTILTYANENTETGTDLTSDYTTGLAFRGVYEPGVVYAVYERGEDGTETFAVDDVNDYAEGHTFWQFSETAQEMGEEKNLYFSNEAAALAYKATHPEKHGMVTKYDGGVCYYNLWIRHANIDADPHKPFEMEYAIVRNNIYRIGVEFSGPGTPTPEIREPDNIISRIFTRKWNFRCLEEVVL